MHPGGHMAGNRTPEAESLASLGEAGVVLPARPLSRAPPGGAQGMGVGRGGPWKG